MAPSTRGAEVAGLRLLDATAMPSDSESASESTVTNVTWWIPCEGELWLRRLGSGFYDSFGQKQTLIDRDLKQFPAARMRIRLNTL